MFGWVDFRENEKKKKSGKGVWLRGGGGEKSGETQLFSLWAHQNSISPKWREKEEDVRWTKLPLLHPIANFLPFFFFFWDKILHSTH